MKRILLIITLLFAVLMCRTPTADAAMDYSLSDYLANKAYIGAGNYNDPLWQLWTELDASLISSSGASSIYLTPGTAPTGVEGTIYYDSSSHGLLVYTGSAFVTIDTAGASSLDTAYNTGRPISVDAGTITLTASDAANNDVLTIVQSDATGGSTGITITNAGTGPSIQIDGSSTGDDITGTGDTWTISEAGVATLVGAIVGSTDLIFSEYGEGIRNDTNLEIEFFSPTADVEDFSIGLGANTNIITFSSDSGATTIDWGAMTTASGMTTITGDAADFTIGSTGDADGEDVIITQAGTGNNSVEINSAGSGTDAIKINASAAGIDIDSVDDMAITNTSTTDADDFVIEQVGANDASLIIQSAGTGGDALSFITSAATGDIKVNSGDMIDIDAADDILIDLAGAAGEDILITNTGGSITLSATEAVADAIVLSAGTALGGIDITSNADIDITTTGASGEDISITNTGGSVNITATEAAADAVVITSTGGVDITTSATYDIDITATGGKVLVNATEDAAGAVSLITNGGTSETIVLTNTLGEGTDAFNIDASAGGVDIDSVKDVAVDLSGSGANFDVDSAAGSIYLDGGEAAANAIVIDASNAAGGIDIDAGTGGINMLATGGDVTITNTTAKDIIIDAQAGRVLITGTESAADAIALVADGTNGEISLSAKVGGIDIDAASGPIAIDASGAAGDLITITNTSGTGASATTQEDAAIQLYSVAGGVGITSGLAAADAVRIEAQGANGQITIQNILGTTASATTQSDASIQLVSQVGGIGLLSTLNGADAVRIETNGGANNLMTLQNINGTGAAATTEEDASIQLYSQVGGIGITSGLSAADAIRIETQASGGLLTIQSAAGTNASAIGLIATAGGITAKVADEKALQIGNADLDAYFIVDASATAGNEDVRIINTNGTNAQAIEILASAGGISAECADEKAVYIGNNEATTFVKVSPSATAGTELIAITNAVGTADTAIALTSTAGGITAKIADEKNLVLGNAGSDSYFKLAASATPASEIISMVNSAGTANGALVLTSTAGGVDINAKEMVKVDVASGTAATAVITLTNTPGTDEAAISLQSVAGGVDIDAALAKNVAITGGQVLVNSLDNVASAIALTTNVGTTETIVITNTLGDTTAAINIDATAGGIDIDSAKDVAIDLSAAGANFDVDSALGSVYLDGGEADAAAVKLHASHADGGIDVDFGTGNMTVTGTGASADFVLDCDLFSIDGTGTSNISITANAGGEDFTVKQDGAVDASLILASDGTAADALQVTAGTGGIVMTTGLATGILINTATYEHKIKYFPISQGVVAASEVIVGGGCGLVCTSLDAGVNEAGATEGYAAVGDDEDVLIFSIPLPDDFVDTGTQADLIIEFDISEQAAEECNIDIRIFEYDAVANATAIITDTVVAANDATRAWKGLVTNSAGIGNEADLDSGDHLIIEITATADADDFNIYGIRLTYRVGLQATN